MNIAGIFIRRPIMTTLVMTAIVLFGIMGYRLLPVNDLPTVDFPTISVRANLPGASPETMASSVATPLEKQFSTIAGLDSMTSTNMQGSTRITLQFSLDKDIDAAAQDVQSMISKVARQLPKDMPTPPSYQKVNPAAYPILYLALSSPVLTLSAVDEYAETFIAQKISMINGVAQVDVYGSQKYAVRIQLNPKLLASKGIGIDEVANAVDKSNVNLPTGTLYGSSSTLTIQATGQLYNAEAYRPLIVAYRNGSPVRLQELGKVIDSIENDKEAGWYNNTRAVILAVQRQPGTNTIEVVDAIKKLLPAFRSQMPGSVSLDILYDRSESIRESVNDVQFTLLLAIGLVVLVIFLFLRNLSATIIPSLALPISIIFTFTAMYLFGYSINNLSLMALILAVGFVVDDAIVMLENIVRHIEKGETVFQAALNGSKEIGFTILSMTLSLVAVFIPVLFMGGIYGRLLHEFAVTISMAILVSGFVSLSLTPMLCSRFIKPYGEEKHGKFYMSLEKIFDAMLDFYKISLQFVLRHRLTAMIVNGILLLLTLYLLISPEVKKGFLPTEDTGRIMGTVEAQEGISFESMIEHQKTVTDIISKDPNVDSFMSRVGASGLSSGNTGRILISLKPLSERNMDSEQIRNVLRKKLSEIPGVQVFLQIPQSIQSGGLFTKSKYQFSLQSLDTAELYKYTSVLEAKLKSIPELQDVTSDLQIKNPQVNVEIDRDRSSALGIAAEQIEDALATAYASRSVSTIYAPIDQYQVIMEVEPQYQMDPSALSLLYIRSSKGSLVPLDTVTKLSQNTGTLSVNHIGQFPAVTISFDLKPGVSIGDAVKIVEETSRDTLPQTINASFQGTAQAFQSSLTGLWILIIMAILVIYLVLGILYESFIHPITILSGLPSAGFGALMTIFLFDKLFFSTELNLYGFVGIILLIGIVKKNAIMMIDFALDAQRKEGEAPIDAIYQGAIIRFRPIMMTTMSALMGIMPIAFGLGAGGGARQSLGLVVVGGLIFSQIVTLYITPVFYIYMEALHNWAGRLVKKQGENN